MQLPKAAKDVAAHDRQMADINVALHDLCQPLTTLQCRLEIAGLVGSPEAYREGVEEGLAECRRMMQVVGTMREAVQRGLGDSLDGKSEARR